MTTATENKAKSLFFVLSCVILWAFLPVASRLGQADLDNYQFLFWSNLLSFGILFFTTAFSGKISELKGYRLKELLIALGLGFLGTFLYNLLLYFGYAHAKGLEVLVIQYTWPLFIVIFSAFFLNEKISFRNIVAVVFGFTGVLVVLTKGKLQEVNLGHLSADLIVLFGAAVFGLFSVLGKKVKFEPFSLTTLFFLSGTVCSLMAMLFFSSFALPSKQALLPILANGIFINGFSYVLENQFSLVSVYLFPPSGRHFVA